MKNFDIIVCDEAAKVFDTESFPQHNIAGLTSDITSIVLFCQEKPLRWKDIHRHKHTHIHTHTHTHTHIHTLTHITAVIKWFKNTENKNK